MENEATLCVIIFIHKGREKNTFREDYTERFNYICFILFLKKEKPSKYWKI